jgi:hypothetical protein
MKALLRLIAGLNDGDETRAPAGIFDRVRREARPSPDSPPGEEG